MAMAYLEVPGRVRPYHEVTVTVAEEQHYKSLGYYPETGLAQGGQYCFKETQTVSGHDTHGTTIDGRCSANVP